MGKCEELKGKTHTNTHACHTPRFPTYISESLFFFAYVCLKLRRLVHTPVAVTIYKVQARVSDTIHIHRTLLTHNTNNTQHHPTLRSKHHLFAPLVHARCSSHRVKGSPSPSYPITTCVYPARIAAWMRVAVALAPKT